MPASAPMILLCSCLNRGWRPKMVRRFCFYRTSFHKRRRVYYDFFFINLNIISHGARHRSSFKYFSCSLTLAVRNCISFFFLFYYVICIMTFTLRYIIFFMLQRIRAFVSVEFLMFWVYPEITRLYKYVFIFMMILK